MACRAAVKDSSQMINLALDEGCLGHVVDLAWVEDDKEARVLSWAAGAKDASATSSSNTFKEDGGGFMKALVYETVKDGKKALKKAFKKGDPLSFFPLNRMVSGSLLQTRQELCESDMVELPEILLNTGEKPSGNPKHMVNILKLRNGNPFHCLRGKVFHAIFKNKIIMDKNKHAESFIEHLLAQGEVDIPTIYTKEGRCFRGDGLMGSTNENMPARLDFVFGAPPSEGQSTIVEAEGGITMILIPCCSICISLM